MAGGARRAFDATLDRVDGLLAIHATLHGTVGRPKRHVSDVVRGALVLGVAALDALVLASVVEAIPRLAKKGGLGPNASKWTKDQPDEVMACFGEADPHQALANLFKEQLGVQTFQHSMMIEGVLTGVLQCAPPWGKAAALLSSSQGVVWTPDEVTEWLDVYVKRRNRIVHDGDLKPGSTRAQPIQRRFVLSAIEVVRAVGEAVTLVVNQRVKTA